MLLWWSLRRCFPRNSPAGQAALYCHTRQYREIPLLYREQNSSCGEVNHRLHAHARCTAPFRQRQTYLIPGSRSRDMTPRPACFAGPEMKAAEAVVVNLSLPFPNQKQYFSSLLDLKRCQHRIAHFSSADFVHALRPDIRRAQTLFQYFCNRCFNRSRCIQLRKTVTQHHCH